MLYTWNIRLAQQVEFRTKPIAWQSQVYWPITIKETTCGGNVKILRFGVWALRRQIDSYVNAEKEFIYWNRLPKKSLVGICWQGLLKYSTPRKTADWILSFLHNAGLYSICFTTAGKPWFYLPPNWDLPCPTRTAQFGWLIYTKWTQLRTWIETFTLNECSPLYWWNKLLPESVSWATTICWLKWMFFIYCNLKLILVYKGKGEI